MNPPLRRDRLGDENTTEATIRDKDHHTSVSEGLGSSRASNFAPPQHDNRSAAVMWRQLGFATIPLIPRSKSPAFATPHPPGDPRRGRCRGECGRLGHGFYDASIDVAWADDFWSRYPDFGIGVRPDPGVVVLDVDPRHGGDVALAGLVARHGPLPETLKVVSGRGDGGHHLWFEGVPGPVRQKLSPGIDILCHERSFVVVPPSRHWQTHAPYTLYPPASDSIAVAPDWLRQLAKLPQRTPLRVAQSTFGIPPSRARHRFRGLVRKVAESAEGERHSLLYWAAARAAAEGLVDREDPFFDTLTDAAIGAGLPEGEVVRVISDAVLRVQRSAL